MFAPLDFSRVEADESVRFSWFARNSQDFFYVAFNEYRSFGWETAYFSRQTVLSSLYLTAAEVGLTPGSWYWRVCYGWYDYPSNCYYNDEIRQLDVEEPPFLTLSSARYAARRYARLSRPVENAPTLAG